MSEKQCRRCEEVKDRADFYRQQANKDGLQRDCKACQRELFRSRRAAEPEKFNRAASRSRKKRAELEGWQQDPNTQRRTARRRLNDAIKGGHIIRPTECSRCEQKCTPQAHHPDYRHPFDVEWLCTSCHHAEHHPEHTIIGGNA